MLRTPIGTHDSLPADSARRKALEREFDRLAELYGFGRLETPIFEASGVFERVGEGTDVVRKEMYRFTDQGDREMALRPEGTAAVCRAFIQHNPLVPWKVTYGGPFFRYEAPQAGRFRQFHQLGAETLGTDDPAADVELIAFAHSFLKAVGLEDVHLLVNSMGDTATLTEYVRQLGVFLAHKYDDMDPADRLQAAAHPLRVLDSKRPATIAVVSEAPKITDALNQASHERFEAVKAGLKELGIQFRIEPRLVRGLDYYRHTTFEFKAPSLRSAQDTICGGGRYDGLIESLIAHARRESAKADAEDDRFPGWRDVLRGQPRPPDPPDAPDDSHADLADVGRTDSTGGVGFAVGVERLLLACDAEGAFEGVVTAPQVWVVDTTEGEREAGLLTAELRGAGISADRAFGGRSMRAQLRAANRSGALLAAIVGDHEVAGQAVSLRMLREHADPASTPHVERQWVVPRTDWVNYVRKALADGMSVPAVGTTT